MRGAAGGIWFLGLIGVGCGQEQDTGRCIDAPGVYWEDFGEGFLTGSCQSCHATTAPDRNGAPEEVIFDTVEDAWEWRDSILDRATGESPTMPPLGGVTEDARMKLTWWLLCGEEGS